MGNALFQLPLSIVIDKEKSLAAFDGALPADINEYFAIALMLIQQRALGPSSFWAPYIDVLPTTEEVDPTLVWPEEDLALLETSPLVAATRSLKRKLAAEFALLEEQYMRARSDVFDPSVFTFEAYLWAFINIFSRAIRVKIGGKRGPSGEEEESIIMCPYADLINHNPFANTYIVAEKPFKMFNPIRGEEVITIYADKDYKKMEQVREGWKVFGSKETGKETYTAVTYPPSLPPSRPPSLPPCPLPPGVHFVWAQEQRRPPASLRLLLGSKSVQFGRPDRRALTG
jgi:hypothetical protein